MLKKNTALRKALIEAGLITPRPTSAQLRAQGFDAAADAMEGRGIALLFNRG